LENLLLFDIGRKGWALGEENREVISAFNNLTNQVQDAKGMQDLNN
jgi:hypothetical protein